MSAPMNFSPLPLPVALPVGLTAWQFSIVAYSLYPTRAPTQMDNVLLYVLVTLGLTRMTFLTVP